MPPEEIRVSSQTPDGNGFAVDLREKKFAITGPNVALLLLIGIIGGVAYLRTGTIDATLKAGQAQIAGTEDRVQKRMDQLFIRIDKLIDDLHGQNTLLNANNAKVTAGQHDLRAHFDERLVQQDALVHQQTGAIDTKIESLKKYVEDWFTEVGKRLEIANFNVLHPDRALPLRSPLPPEDRAPERGRPER